MERREAKKHHKKGPSRETAAVVAEPELESLVEI